MPRKGITKLKEACRLAQLFARLRDTDESGHGVCCSCGKPVSYWKDHGGHWVPKGRHINAASTDPRNIHIQCYFCNKFAEGGKGGYALFMYAKYGIKIMKELVEKAKELLSVEQAEEDIKEYTEMCLEEAKNKNWEVKVIPPRDPRKTKKKRRKT